VFNLFKKKEPSVQFTIRDTLFGDMPISEWPKSDESQNEPWISFIQARKFLNAKDNKQAIAALQKIAETPDLEPRHYLQAWHFLRQLGVNPPADKAKLVYGVVIEVGLPKGADIVAAYTDYTARYLNFTGAGEIWDHPNNSLDVEIDALLKAGQEVAHKIGPWDQLGHPSATPTNGNVRLNMLTPSGLHFGEGGFQTLSNEPMGNAIISPATALMQRLTSLRK
jgi:hypothetical protein